MHSKLGPGQIQLTVGEVSKSVMTIAERVR